MRTTLSIDDDVAALLSQEMRRSGDTLKGAVNHYLRLGLMASGERRQKPFAVTPRALGLPRGLNYDCTASLLEDLEETGGQ